MVLRPAHAQRVLPTKRAPSLVRNGARARARRAVVASVTLALGIWASGAVGPIGALGAAAGASVRLPVKSVKPSGVGAQSGELAHRTVMQDLPGDWLGPFPAPPGACGYEYAEWFLYATGSYTLTWNSDNCGGSTSYGKYAVTGNLLSFNQKSVPSCPECTQREVIRVTFRFVTSSALRLCNYPTGQCYLYYRQR